MLTSYQSLPFRRIKYLQKALSSIVAAETCQGSEQGGLLGLGDCVAHDVQS